MCKGGGCTWLWLSLTMALVNGDTGKQDGVQTDLLACVGWSPLYWSLPADARMLQTPIREAPDCTARHAKELLPHSLAHHAPGTDAYVTPKATWPIKARTMPPDQISWARLQEHGAVPRGWPVPAFGPLMRPLHAGSLRPWTRL